MNQAIVDDAYGTLRYENRINAFFRHCKIGKVTKKQSPLAPLLGPLSQDFYEELYRPVPMPAFQGTFLVG